MAVKQAAKNRLSSLSGFPVKDGLAGFATGNREGKPAEREQSVLTPQVIVDVWNGLWGCISLDPCWTEGAITRPEIGLTKADDGLSIEWVSRTFINPPYKDLKVWLAHGMLQPREQGWLVPVRTHRKWWRAWRDSLDVYVELDSGIKFLGYDQAFPAPLLLGYLGDHVEQFVQLAGRLGGVYRRDAA